MLGIVALTLMLEGATKERFGTTASGGIAIDVRRRLEVGGEAVTVFTDDVSEGLRERCCMC